MRVFDASKAGERLPVLRYKGNRFWAFRGIKALSLAMLVAGMPGSSRARDNDVPIGASGSRLGRSMPSDKRIVPENA